MELSPLPLLLLPETLLTLSFGQTYVSAKPALIILTVIYALRFLERHFLAVINAHGSTYPHFFANALALPCTIATVLLVDAHGNLSLLAATTLATYAPLAAVTYAYALQQNQRTIHAPSDHP